MSEQQVTSRYVLYEELASGGMGVVHLGRLVGPAGFGRTVAVKRLHPHLAKQPQFVEMFLDEARVAGRVRHPNVVSTLDVVSLADAVFLVMEYVEGEALSKLLQECAARAESVPLPIASAIISHALLGLQAAHGASGAGEGPVGVVHRDVSPPNLLIGVDGVTRLSDFGIAKAAGRMQTTRDGQIKGKASYMAPEQLRGQPVDARTDLYGVAVVCWELLTGKRLFEGDTPEETMTRVLEHMPEAPSTFNPAVPPALDAWVLRGASKMPGRRFASAPEMAAELERIVGPATPREVGEWVAAHLPELGKRAARLAALESETPPASSERVSFAFTPKPALSSVPAPVLARRSWVIVVALALAFAAAVSIALAWRASQAEPVAAPLEAAVVKVESPKPSPPTRLDVSATPAAVVPLPVRKRAVTSKHCTPPFTVNADGYRVPKPECF